MLAIRLQRVGRKKQPLYRMVVSEKAKDMYGDHLEILGQYNPHKKEANLKEDRIKYWISKGAQTSPTVNNLLINNGLLDGGKAKSVRITKKRAAKKEEASQQAAAASEEKKEVAAPAEEVKEEVKTEEPKAEASEEKAEETK